MSVSFSFLRLGKLITKQFFENVRLYTFSVLALFSLLALVFAFFILSAGPNYHEEGTWFIFLIGLFLSGSVFASMAFNMLHSKDKGIYWLSLPATHGEKLVCTIFYTTIVFTAVYCVCFFIVKWIAVYFIHGLIKEDPRLSYTEITDYIKGFGEVLPYFICAYFAVQALYLLGAVYFSRYTFVVTSVVGAMFIFAFIYYLSKVEEGFLGQVQWNIVSAKKTDIGIQGHYHLYSVSPAISTLTQYFVQFAWAPLFWIVTFYRLKEKEI